MPLFSMEGTIEMYWKLPHVPPYLDSIVTSHSIVFGAREQPVAMSQTTQL